MKDLIVLEVCVNSNTHPSFEKLVSYNYFVPDGDEVCFIIRKYERGDKASLNCYITIYDLLMAGF
jgi:hypothetical protein